jgi:DNA-directed RNA polymerase subunit alpha
MFENVKLRYNPGDGKSGQFVIEPLPQGYGITLGNALRRVLLSSLPGAAITAVKVRGVTHEFSSLKGVKEDMVQLLLNLKRVRIKLEGTESTTLKISASGPGNITASAIELPSGVTIVNPDEPLATLSDSKTKLEAELTVEAGTGYVPVEDRKSSGIGLIPLDAVYSPVTRANYNIEPTRVGQFTNYDKLTMDITTDGTMDPETAIKKAAEILVGAFGLLVEPAVEGGEEEKVPHKKIVGKVDGTATIEELELPTRVNNALHSAGIESINDLLTTPQDKLATIKNLGAKSVKDIEARLVEKGLAV